MQQNLKAAGLLKGYYRQLELDRSKTAFVIDSIACTYQNLADRIVACQRTIAEADFQQGGRLRVAISLFNGVDVAAWYIWAVQHGHVLILLDPTWQQDHWQFALQLTQPHIEVSQDSPGDAVEVLMNTKASGRDVSRCEDSSLQEMFLIGFTSGSSGRPKAFTRSADSWVSSFAASAKEFDTRSGSVVLAPGPLSHGLSFYAMAEVFHHGATFISQSAFSATDCDRLLRGLLHSEGAEGTEGAGQTWRTPLPDLAFFVPTMLQAVLDVSAERPAEALATAAVPAVPAAGHSAEDSCRLRSNINGSPGVRIVTAGAKLTVQQRRRCGHIYPGVRLSEYYGASELSFVSVNHGWDAVPEASVGRLFHSVELKLSFENEREREREGRESARSAASAVQTGLIKVSSAMLAAGYVERYGEQLRISSISDDEGFATVGDCGYLDPNGFLFLLERDDRMLNSGGLKVYPSYVESVVNDFISGQAAASDMILSVVVGMADEYWGECVTLVVQLAERDPTNLATFKTALQAYCLEHLQANERPRRFYSCRQLPQTSSGKIHYARIRDGLSGLATASASFPYSEF